VSAIRVIIADDHGLVRRGLRELLKQVDGVEVIAEATSGYEAVELALSQRPHVVLMDISMAGMNGLEAAKRIVAAAPEVRVLMLSMHSDEQYVSQAIAAGASGYLLKSADVAELDRAIRAVSQGQGYLAPAVSGPVLAGLARGALPRAAETEKLSPRQREVLQLIAEGLSTKAIAQKLKLSAKTVETHRTELMRRLDIHDVAGLVRYAIRHGLVSTDT
jgi:DNA-binding NarL/FixJ family response regulator